MQPTNSDSANRDDRTRQPAREVPPSVVRVLNEYRSRVRSIRIIEAICAVTLALCLSYTCLFALDRVSDTSRWLRATLWLAAFGILVTWMPWIVYRWVWQSRRLEQVARILKSQLPRVGDHLLGIVELAHAKNDAGQSETLVRAALAQADREMTKKSFVANVPHPRHRVWGLAAGSMLLLVLVQLAIFPEASVNAFRRWLSPWSLIERFTFARMEPLPMELVVPSSEESKLPVTLASNSKWSPEQGTLRVANQLVKAEAQDRKFDFRVPPRREPAKATVKIGDAIAQLNIQPEPRPELGGLSAQVKLPGYLQRTDLASIPVRGGAINIVKGSQVQISAVGSRELIKAHVNDQPMQVEGVRVTSALIDSTESKTLKLTWTDHWGLSPAVPLKLQMNVVPDAPPGVSVRELGKQTVLMELAVLTFKVDASDDFGVRRVGLQWKPYVETGVTSTTTADSTSKEDQGQSLEGERVVYAGGPDQSSLVGLSATLNPTRDQIKPQSIELRVFAEDYMPDRPRQYSAPFIVHILSEADHATWLMRRIDAWIRQCFENYDREQQLFHINQELSTQPKEERGSLKSLRTLERQSTAELAQAKRLQSLNELARQVVSDCVQNSKINPQHLDQLTGLITELVVIAEQKMPGTARHLEEAAKNASNSEASLPKALEAQEDLLADYQSILDRLRALMSRIEETSFAVRLQALCQQELKLANEVRMVSSADFGKPPAVVRESLVRRLGLLADKHNGMTKVLQNIMEDMEGSLERTPNEQIQEVLDDMSDEDVHAKCDFVGEQLKLNDSGVATAQCEFLADSFHRWAEQLMRSKSPPPSDKKKVALPPELVVELMRVLKRETDLREETRALEQSRAELAATNVTRQAEELAKVQLDLARRTAKVVDRIIAIPNGEEDYGNDIQRLTAAVEAMRDAQVLLEKGETAVPTIAAETEAIELLKNSRKAGKQKGSGNGGNPGAGSRTGADLESFVELLDSKPTDGLARPDRNTELSSGNETDSVPSEFRSGLDRLYEAMEKNNN